MSAYDPQPGEAETIARQLTVAQRRAVRNGQIGKGSNGTDRSHGYWPLREGLTARGLFTTANLRDVLTPLGKAVQRLLVPGDDPA